MIEARGIKRTFHSHGAFTGAHVVQALRGVDFTLPEGGAVSFIGESGCGKTTLGRILAGLETFDEGTLLVDGVDVGSLGRRSRAELFRSIQLIHQDPYSVLNPTRTVAATLGDPLRMLANRRHGENDESGERGERGAKRRKAAVRARSRELLELVGLEPDGVLSKYPHQLSGGQRQRVVIARALTVDPKVLIADEAVSMIDVSMRLGILSLLRDLRERLGISLVFITHDVATARYLGDGGELHVIYRGEVIERGSVETVIQNPVHPYTQCLLSAVPVLKGLEEPGPDRLAPKDMMDASVETLGCLFEPRCPFATEQCGTEHPDLVAETVDGVDAQHACFHPQVRSVAAVDLDVVAR
ncbi:MAG TPA: ABC transporter ATP-binding protein [Actinospica sp.]|nr:ABC transporter ATP-binding protein [Actinospica sp.]